MIGVLANFPDLRKNKVSKSEKQEITKMKEK